MKTFLSLIFFISFPALAYQSVTCWEGDCLRKGWTRTSAFDGKSTDYQCYRDGCLKDGWIVGGQQGVRYYTQCKNGDCFGQGWYEIDRESQILQRTIRCEGGDCLSRGWITYSSLGSFRTECQKNNCRTQGWQAQIPGGHLSVICKPGGCFQEGWIESSQGSR